MVVSLVPCRSYSLGISSGRSSGVFFSATSLANISLFSFPRSLLWPLTHWKKVGVVCHLRRYAADLKEICVPNFYPSSGFPVLKVFCWAINDVFGVCYNYQGPGGRDHLGHFYYGRYLSNLVGLCWAWYSYGFIKVTVQAHPYSTATICILFPIIEAPSVSVHFYCLVLED